MSEIDEVELVCRDFSAALDLLRDNGFRLDTIWPADEPHTALLSSAQATLRLTSRPEAPRPVHDLPSFRPEFVLTRAEGGSAEGRAGMAYRDLIPGRLGGRYIASHIIIERGGPVRDWVHFHRIALQLIAVRRGWVKVVYEDAGEPFVMHPGDLVLQPSGIRHRVLESSACLEVVEVTCPAVHETLADHEIELPNGFDADRKFGNQHFVRHIAAQGPWVLTATGKTQETAVAAATGGLADVRFLRAEDGSKIGFEPHEGELMFGFLLEGSAELEVRETTRLNSADAFVIPPGEPWYLSGCSNDFCLLQVLTSRLPTSF